MADVFVRPARLIDAGDFAGVQHRTWRAASEAFGLPEPPELSQIERAWEHSITAPPSARHRSWVAVGDEAVVGVAAVTPASDPDLDTERCVELVLLAVDPSARRGGHGSRLLTAAMQTASDNGELEAVSWVTSGDDVVLGFLEESGWVADGAFRTLADSDTDDASELRQVRVSTSLEREAPDA